jgi:ubiquinone/menaquinone biosynthesis C-methylase UbiE
MWSSRDDYVDAGLHECGPGQNQADRQDGPEEPRIAALVDCLDRLSRREEAEVVNKLSKRKLAELEFHDRDRDPEFTSKSSADEVERSRSNRKFYSTVQASREYTRSWIQASVPGQVFLDYACGNGEAAILAAHAGAALAIGIDISGVSIENAKRRAATEGVRDKTAFIQADCEETRLPSDSIDLALCSGMLHHLDLSYAFPELRRILRPGGRCLAVEALDYNPIIKLYRWLTPAMRTQWEREHILSLRDLRFARRFFEVQNVRYWHLLSIATTPLRNSPLFGCALGVANAVDSVLLRVFPFSLFAWMFSFELKKRVERW